jgi:hypothetical protein
MHPGWRYVGYADEGQFVGHVRWRDVLDLIEASLAQTLLPR